MSPSRKHSLDTDSRVSAVGRKRPASNAAVGATGSESSPYKRRKRSAGSKQSEDLSVGSGQLRDFVAFSSLHDTDFAQGRAMAGPNYGQNRLQSGFASGKRSMRSASDPGTDESDYSPPAPSAKPVLEIDSTDEDGGIILNLQNTDNQPIVISDDESSQEEGEYSGTEVGDRSANVSESNVMEHQTSAPDAMQVDLHGDQMNQNEDEPSFVIDTLPTKSQVCLKDLTPNQLEAQIRYAFWDLKREQIDLSRFARCLHCQDEGHIDENCPQKTCEHCGVFGEHESVFCPKERRCDRCRQPGHVHCTGMRNTTIPCDLCSIRGHSESVCVLRHFPRALKFGTGKLQLLITCCRCASKSHTVGDCPELSSAQAARWSLKSLDPDQVVNLSVQKGIDKLEKDAQDRGMRPTGLKIRGRAEQQAAATAAYEEGETDSDDFDQFFSHAPLRQNHQPEPRGRMGAQQKHQSDSYRPSNNGQRYDRYSAPSGTDTYRPPRSAFYATDSFGRPRSRSPPRQGYSAARRSPSPSSESSYRPTDRSRARRPSPPLPARPTFPRGQAPTAPNPSVSINLPSRKGSNSSTKGGKGNNATSSNLPPKPPAVDRFNGSLFSRIEGGPSQSQPQQQGGGGGRNKKPQSQK